MDLTANLPASVQAAALHGTFRLPNALKRAIAGKPVRLDGQELALDAQLLLTLQRLTGRTSLSAPTPALARQAMDVATNTVVRTKLTGTQSRNLRIPTRDGQIDARLYWPSSDPTKATHLMVFYHGGGWVIGDLESHDDLCRFLAREVGIRVLSVAYRCAPEHRFPAALDDAIDGYRYAVEHTAELGATSGAVSVGGDSAGGNLAAAVSLQAKALGLPLPAFQTLFYPAVDSTKRRRSRELFPEGFLLTDADMDWFIDHYLPEVDRRADPRLSVLLTEDLSGLPPAYVVTAGFDPLRDEGEAYARKLSDAGVRVIARRFPDLIHGFLKLRVRGSRFEDAMFEIVGTLRAGLALSGDTGSRSA